MKKPWRAWSDYEVWWIRSHAAFHSHTEMAAQLGRTRQSVRMKLKTLGLARTEAERRANHARAYGR